MTISKEDLQSLILGQIISAEFSPFGDEGIILEIRHKLDGKIFRKSILIVAYSSGEGYTDIYNKEGD